ncbi:hypothetical protein AB4144_30940, partial [Rhizobiaceae sp. 2RAB30]
MPGSLFGFKPGTTAEDIRGPFFLSGKIEGRPSAQREENCETSAGLAELSIKGASMQDAAVLIVGGGPCGLMLANEL